MNLTVGYIFNLSEKFKDIKIIAGSRGIKRKIKDVMIMEAPDGAYWVKEGDFLISAGFGFKDNIEELSEVIKVLNEKKAAGLAIKKGRFIKHIPESVLNLADELDFPLLELPVEISYRDLTWPIMGRIINEENYNLKILEQLRNTLWQIHDEKYDLEDILSLILTYINKTLILLDSRLNIIKYKGKNINHSDVIPVDEIIKHLEEKLIKDNKLPSPSSFHCDGYNYVIFVLKTPDEILGYLCIASKSEITQLDKMVITQSLPFLTIIFLARQKQHETALKLREDFFAGLLLGNYLSESAIEKGAEFFNLETGISRAVVIIDIINNKGNTPNSKLVENIVFDLKSIPELKNQQDIIKKESKIIILYKVNDKKSYSALKNEFRGWFENFRKMEKYKQPQLTFYMGIGKIYKNLGELHKSYQEASLSLKVGPKIFNTKSNVFFYNDLKLYHILFLFKEHPVILDLYNDTIGRLSLYDTENNTSLVQTLITFFENNCSVNQTSRKLYIHRNTLYNRLERISEITGVNTSTAEGQLLLQLALKLREIYNTKEFTP